MTISLFSTNRALLTDSTGASITTPATGTPTLVAPDTTARTAKVRYNVARSNGANSVTRPSDRDLCSPDGPPPPLSPKTSRIVHS